MSRRGTILILGPAGDSRGPAAQAAIAKHGGLFGLPWHIAIRETATTDEIAAAVAVISFGPVGEFGDRVEYWGEQPIPPLADALFARLRPPEKKPTLTAKVGRETAGRRGKGVVTVFDLPLSDDQLKDLAATLKNRCGTGGTVKDGRIEIQGDIRDRVVAELEKLGYKVKRVGG